MKILITDANILIDLLKTDSTDPFFKLKYEIYATLAVIFECDDEQQTTLQKYIKAGRLFVYSLNTEEEERVEKLFKENAGLSFADCTVFYTADKLKATLLTGDKKLRTEVEGKNIEVRGILWVFDEMLKQKVIEKKEYRQKLIKLKEVNKRLPEDELKKRL
jgi:rRNA maturation endonuclease Nob1